MSPLMSPKRNPKFKISLFLLIPSSSVEGRDTCMDLENFYVTPCFSHDYHLMLVEYIKSQNTESVCTMREKETDSNIFFFQKKFPSKKSKKYPVCRTQSWGVLLPCFHLSTRQGLIVCHVFYYNG
jgi:hypothetical protein